MAVITLVKKQHDAAGSKVRIQYKNHEVDHERIERAFKRRKGQSKGHDGMTPEQVALTSLNWRVLLSSASLHPVFYLSSDRSTHSE